MAGNPLYCGCDGIPSGYQYPRIAPSGWNYGGGCNPCAGTGPCPIQLDFNCSIYHKNNDKVNNLGPIGLTNGATLELFADTVASYLAQLNVPDYTLPCLRADYTINTLQQFAQSVDTQLCSLATDIANVATTASTPITPVDSPSVNLSVSGTLNHTLRADVTLSLTAGNQASILSDGLYVTPQVLTADVPNKTISISDGNTIDLTSLVCGVGGFLGNVTADPVAVDGQYWFRTDLSAASGLKIRLNGLVRTITTS